ncbi:MAG: phosphoglycerate kinase [Planctomycetes bacterium]|nr:phosphoglycerate kinase [Planctomycetota bacterium]
MRFQRIDDLDVKGRRVFVRVDFNVPLEAQADGRQRITEDSRIVAAVPTIRELVQRGAKVVLASHLGRPKKGPTEELRLAPCAARLAELLGKPVAALKQCIGAEVDAALARMQPGDVVLLENVRFHPEEEAGDAAFAAKLKNGCELYVNDAFGTAHRAHASVTGVAALLPAKARAAGRLMEAEMKALARLLADIQRPFVAVLGGAKVSDKIKVVDNLLDKVDALLIGGGMAYTFLAAQGRAIGSSKCEKDKLDVARAALAKAATKKVRIVLPIDHVAATGFDEKLPAEAVAGVDVPEGRMGLDIGPKSAALFAKDLAAAKTIVWNGPLGVFEWKAYENGSKAVAEAIAAATKAGATTVVGGGDSVAVIEQFGLQGRYSHVSTGGGAFLEALEGSVLPGIQALLLD